MGLENLDLFTIDVKSIHLFESGLQVIGSIETNFSSTRPNSLMSIGVGNFSTLAEYILQFGPAAA